MNKLNNSNNQNNGLEIAIIGMTGLFSGAKNIDEFWKNIQDGVESISFFSERELEKLGIEPTIFHDPNYVNANGVVEDIELFDASFFGFSPREAEVIDPQQRFLLEYAWEALESAGYSSEVCRNQIGIFAGASINTYISNIYSNPDVVASVGGLQISISNDPDFLTTRVSYKLNLEGPSYTVQTTCSTSLVTIHLACQSLLSGECDIALAGGVSISKQAGYFYQEGGIYSPDGHCRAFDAKAQGTVKGKGLGLVVLKRLEEAIADGDYIHAIIKGSAINNDGSSKVSYSAPSINGQAKVIRAAQTMAEVEPETIAYIEAHGTGTPLGDPIEITALTQVFSAKTQKKNFCAIGSVKTNIGHLGPAAGVAGLIKTVLALKHKQIPPSLHFEEPNSQIDFANSPFYVNTKLSEWKTNGTPRRAGVSSFGFGGTNAHVILEEAPTIEPSNPSGPYQLLLLSAKTITALETTTANLVAHMQQHSDLHLADIAYTLQVGRRSFEHRRMVVCQDLEDAVKSLHSLDQQRVFSHSQEPCNRPVVFMFSGQGAQYVNMGQELYESELTFREQVDDCCELLKPHLGLDLRTVLYPSEETAQKAAQQLLQTAITQPALFVIEYALSKLWMTWGVHPEAMIGHSIGEYVAACLAGVFSLEDALALVAIRGKLMQQLSKGAMLSVQMSEQQVQPLLNKELSLAGSNGPLTCVVSGTTEAVEELEQKLLDKEIGCRRLHTSHAFHSQMMEPIIKPFTQFLEKVKLNPPKIPFVSNVSGTWIAVTQATDPNYWARHLRQPVRFSEGVTELLKQPERILLEVGPGRTLSSLAKQHQVDELIALTSIRHPQEQQSDVAFLLNTLGRLWLLGVQIDWSGFYVDEKRHRIPLPTYPFERQRYWIEPQKQALLERQVKQKSTASELWKSLVEACQIQDRTRISELHSPTYLAKKQSLDSLLTAYMSLALRHLGAFNNPSNKYSVEELFEQLPIIPRYRQLLYRWLEVLVEHNLLQQHEKTFTNLVPLSINSLSALIQDVRVRWADIPHVVDETQYIGENLAAVLTGEKEPLSLYVGLSRHTGESPSPELPLYAYFKAIMRAGIEQVVKSLPPQVNLRILEIGAGTGIATTELLPLLPLKQTKYTFTDLGSFFLNQAQQKFGAYPFVEYRLLDIEQPPEDQGYSSHSFDVVVAVNVLHVTRKMEETLEHVRSLLAPEGIFLLWEVTQPEPTVDIGVGLLMNPLEDEERSRGNPYLSKEQWHKALNVHGFDKVVAFPETDDLGEYVLVAQASSSAALSTPSAFTVLVEQKDADKISQVLLDKKPDIADWFYIPSWKRLMPPQPFKSKVQGVQSGCWLVFVDECGLGLKMVKQLELEGQDVVTVRVGDQFTNESKFLKRVYTINPGEQEDYYALLEELRALDLTPKTIVHLWSVTPKGDTELSIESLEQSEVLCFYSLVFLAQALGKENLTDSLQIGIVSNNIQEVITSDLVCPEKAIALGPCKVISQEYPNIICRSIDVVIPETESWQEKKLIDQLLAELTTELLDRVVAYRGNHRWVQTFEPVRLDEAVEGKPRLREEGVYLITGGLGGVGLLNAEYLAKTVHAKLILIGRSVFPNRDEWSQWLLDHDEHDSISHKIRKLQELETLGAEVLVINADVTNREHMKATITQANNRFGKIHGVIHNATESKQELIAQKTFETGRVILAPKVMGTLILHDLFKDADLDFFVLTSSQASVIGGMGEVEYTAECAFLDAFAYYSASKYDRFISSMNWNRWNTPEWIAKTNLTRVSELTLEEAALTLEEGMEAFRRILVCSTMPQVVVSSSDFNHLINQNLINLKDTLDSLEEQFSRVSRAKPTHKRPNLKNAYVAPHNEIEWTLVDIWQETFGIEQVGIYDNFFELGGDSLLVTILLSRLRKTFKIELPYKSFFDEPTVAKLAEVIAQILAEQTDQEQQTQMLAEIEKLSEEEAQTILLLEEQLIEPGDENE